MTGLAPREFEIPFPGSLVSTFLRVEHIVLRVQGLGLRLRVQGVRLVDCGQGALNPEPRLAKCKGIPDSSVIPDEITKHIALCRYGFS